MPPLLKPLLSPKQRGAQNLAASPRESLLGIQGAPWFPVLAELGSSPAQHTISWWMVFNCGKTEAGLLLTPSVPKCSMQGEIPFRKRIPG